MYLPRISFIASKTATRFFYQPQFLVSTTHLYRGLATKSKDDVSLRIKVEPIKRHNEPLDRKRARLIYQSRKRGILETDLLLGGFAAKYLKEMTPEQLAEYDSLLDELDWDIYYWATKNYETSPIPEKWKNSELMKKLQVYAENKDKKILRMPDLKEYQ
ncbi:hypothetical protein ZYGR_0H00580 [Zygosaccharomyces rouxii]|uniref:Succinate dehydrogenase assembly factor 2, mitochondrial n=2 Tax=Zygosaccharomyces rouxii TaxID=4956 RepID=C5DR39_ZYGRC|nr:uncharacterized protein ZYRO0B05324g [Zygosaccharomyces rouxii]KAH9200204.1 Flavinator of succinate dehydrogenase-domain-containing protein [Zygosaccharomyces rouxii]GAV47217.1 hypothetical protein ZYGR_0H00580 [Zygosaccharomyces rouxii]CAR26250.1 ZYRO0B05324p [Zygosaccharomyces rouxii]